jgi:hypothetical protein
MERCYGPLGKVLNTPEVMRVYIGYSVNPLIDLR